MNNRIQKRIVMVSIAGVGVALLFIFCLVLYFQAKQSSLEEQLQIEYETKWKERETMDQAGMTQVLVANRALRSGTTLQVEDVKLIELPTATIPSDALKEINAGVGKITKIDMQPNTPISVSMLFEDQPIPRDLRVQEFNVIQLPTDLKKGEFVDVRINFPTGEDFIVLSKKKVQDLSGTIVWVHMNEMEILNASSAIIDAYLQGAKLYALTYVDPGMQEAAIVNYPANPVVLDLMERDPNILEEAKTDLARQLRIVLDNNLEAMSETDKMRVMSGNVMVQQQLQNERITTQQNNDFRESHQQQKHIQEPSVPPIQPEAPESEHGEPSSERTESRATLPSPETEVSPPDPIQEIEQEEDPPASQRLEDIFDQPNEE